MTFTVQDSGERVTFDSGMVRDTTEGKVDYSLVYDGPMLRRWAEHLTRGAVKYEPRNWLKADDRAALDRFRASAARHFAQWMAGERTEDHAAAVMFNLNGAEYVRGKLVEVGPTDASRHTWIGLDELAARQSREILVEKHRLAHEAQIERDRESDTPEDDGRLMKKLREQHEAIRRFDHGTSY